MRSDVDELKARLANLEKAQDTSEPVKIEPENSEVTPLLSAHRQLLRAIVRNDIELVKRYVENARRLIVIILELTFPNSTLKASSSLASARHANGWYPIHAAVLTGNLDMVKLIFEKCDGEALTLTYTDSWEYDTDSPTPAEFLLREEELGKRAKLTKTKGCTALHFACWTGNIDIIKYLVERGASFEAGDYAGHEPHEYFDIIEHADVLSQYHELKRIWANRDWEFREGAKSFLIGNGSVAIDIPKFSLVRRLQNGVEE